MNRTLPPPPPGARPVTYIGLGQPDTPPATTVTDMRTRPARGGNGVHITLTGDNGTTAELVYRILPDRTSRISRCANWQNLEPLANNQHLLDDFYQSLRQGLHPTLGRGA